MNEVTKEKEYGLNRGNLKMIALFCMTLDHFSCAIFESWISRLTKGEALYYALVGTDFLTRGVGRIAFPIYCFFIVEGLLHTKSVTKYALRLLLLAFISEVPFDMVIVHKYYSTTNQNVFWTLLIGLIAIYAMDSAFKKFSEKPAYIVSAIAGISACLAAQCFRTDYGGVGVMTVIVIYLVGQNKIRFAMLINICAQLIKLLSTKSSVGLLVLNLVSVALFSLVIIMSTKIVNINSRKAYVACATLSTLNLYEMFAMFNVVILDKYNGEKGKGYKWLFYFYYPVHLAAAAGLCMLVGLY